MRNLLAVVALLSPAAVGCGDDEHIAAADARVAPDAAGPDAPTPPLEVLHTWGGYGSVEPGKFVEPSSVELDSLGDVYVAGHENRIQKFTGDGVLIEIWGETGTGPGQFNHPHGLTIDRARGDIVYVGDQENHRVQAFDRDGTYLREFTSAMFVHLHDIGIDPTTGDIYVGDYILDIVQRFSPTGVLVDSWGGTGNGPGFFHSVWGVSTDSAGNVYVVDTFNGRVQKFDTSGDYVLEWGGFGKPTGIFVDVFDVVYVVDALAQTVQRFDTVGTLLETWDLRSILGKVTEPEDIVIDPTGEDIYITEVLAHEVFHLTRVKGSE